MEYVITKINGFISNIVWGVPTLILIAITGAYYSVILKGLQFRHFGFLLKKTIGMRLKNCRPDSDGRGDMSSFQAAMTSVSAIVGSGNIAGVATAIVSGGPGALFWMIIAA